MLEENACKHEGSFKLLWADENQQQKARQHNFLIVVGFISE